MNLARHAAVLWRFRIVTATGLFLGISLAVLSSYSISFSGTPSLTTRGESTWNSDSSLLVTQPGFPEGRVTLPETPTNDASQVDGKMEPLPKDRLEFADPNRFGALADLYSQLLMSDRIRLAVPEKPKPEQIQASALQGASGGVILPVIKLTVSASTKARAESLSKHAIEALQRALEDDQAQAQIPPKQRVVVRILNVPSEGYLFAGPSKTASMLLLVLSLIGTLAVTHLLAALRDRNGSALLDGIIDPWSSEAGNDKVPEPASVWGAAPPAPRAPAPPPPAQSSPAPKPRRSPLGRSER